MKVQREHIFLCAFVTVTIIFWFCLPSPLFKEPFSTVVVDQNGNLLSARIANDGQWRFPAIGPVPQKFRKALLLYEDRYFFLHPGMNPMSIIRACVQNFRQGEIVSGGSTLTMQVIRLSRKNRHRNLFTKVTESIQAIRLECQYHKSQILDLYASHAPFGGNVVGLDAACWRYFGRSKEEISWSEAALLAILPNHPALLHPGRNRDLLLAKRNRLLHRLHEEGELDSMSYTLALEEPLPEKPLPLPDKTPHLLNYLIKTGHGGKTIHSTINVHTQSFTEEVLNNHHHHLRQNGIWNGAVLVLETQTGQVLSYVGNVRSAGWSHEGEVDMIQANRSSGSILKPFLYSAMMDEGKILPHQLIADIPIVINGFAPQNFHRDFDGAVPADQALIRSLNIPAVEMLRDYRYEKFHGLLQRMGKTTLIYEPDHYGLSLILGGGESKLWELAGMYASLGRVLCSFQKIEGNQKYRHSDYHSPKVVDSTKHFKEGIKTETGLLSASAIWQTLETMTEVHRPGDQAAWSNFSSSRKIAWKTGTSFGMRDAWAIGITPDFVVAVWMGNADGEGRPGLTGASVAAPVMFEIFSGLPRSSGWFEAPSAELTEVTTCAKSGYLAGPNCDLRKNIAAGKNALRSPVCPYHRILHLDKEGKHQLNSDCVSISEIRSQSWFSLPPVEEYYYRMKNPDYKLPPPFSPDCAPAGNNPVMQWITPKPGAKLYLPRQLDGSNGGVTFKLAHQQSKETVYWHLDNAYLGKTEHPHQMTFWPGTGKHHLLLIDDNGFVLTSEFEILNPL